MKTKITQKEFENIKDGLKILSARRGGLKMAQKLYGRSGTTLWAIKHFPTLEAYNQYNLERFAKIKPIRVEKETEKNVPACDQLTRIAEALERLVVAWEAKPRGFFKK